MLAILVYVVSEFGLPGAAIAGPIATIYSSLPTWWNHVYPSTSAASNRPREPQVSGHAAPRAQRPSAQSFTMRASAPGNEPFERRPPRSLRQLVADALTDGQISDLAYDHFPPVWGQYTAGMGRDDKARRLADYATLQRREDELLRFVAELNPAAYDAYRRQDHGKSESVADLE